VATVVGLIALAGLAAQFGVVMLLYLRRSIAARLALGVSLTPATLDEAIRDGAMLRVRPKAMTVAIDRKRMLRANASRHGWGWVDSSSIRFVLPAPISHLAGWYLVLIAVGAPRLLLAAVVALLREPARQERAFGAANGAPVSLKAALQFARLRVGAFLYHFGGLPRALTAITTGVEVSNCWRGELRQAHHGNEVRGPSDKIGSAD
jgi:hypothetical protein